MSSSRSTIHKINPAEVEQRWSSKKGKVSTLEPDKILLWNFDIFSSSLKSEHINKIRDMVSRWRGLLLKNEAIVLVTGRASGAGEENFNAKIAMQRSKEVESFLYILGLGKEQVFLDSQGRELPAPPNQLAIGMAQNRSVELTFVKIDKSGISETSKGVNGKQKSLAKSQGQYDVNERVYVNENPKGEVSKIEPNAFVLWNYNISSSQLKPEHKKMLDEIVKQIGKDAKVFVEGHASKTASEIYNKKLSHVRALEVAEYLLRYGLKEENIIVKSFGYSKPWFENETSTGMAHNRRVEIRIIASEKPKSPVQPFVAKPIKTTEPGLKFPEITEIIPNQTYEFKYEVDFLPVNLKYLIIYPIVIFNGKVTIKTKSLTTIEFSNDIIKNKIAENIKFKLDNNTLKIDATEGKMSLEFEDVELSPEFELNLKEIKDFRKPFSVTLTPMKTEKLEIQLAPDIKMEVELNTQVKFDIQPNLKELLKDLKNAGEKIIVNVAEGVIEYGVSNAVIATLSISAIAGSVYLTLKLPSIIEDEVEKGLSKVKADTYLRGYAARLAAESITGLGVESSKAYYKKMLFDQYVGLDTAGDIQKGWLEAERYISGLKSSGRLENFLKGIKNRYRKMYPEDLEYELLVELKNMYDYQNNRLPDVYAICQ